MDSNLIHWLSEIYTLPFFNNTDRRISLIAVRTHRTTEGDSMDPKQIENEIISSSRNEQFVAGASLVAALVGYFVFPQARFIIGCVGVIVWGIYALLYLSEKGPGRSWLGAFLPAAVAFFFLTWALGG
jgi:hypothetical protein